MVDQKLNCKNFLQVTKNSFTQHGVFFCAALKHESMKDHRLWSECHLNLTSLLAVAGFTVTSVEHTSSFAAHAASQSEPGLFEPTKVWSQMGCCWILCCLIAWLGSRLQWESTSHLIAAAIFLRLAHNHICAPKINGGHNWGGCLYRKV